MNDNSATFSIYINGFFSPFWYLGIHLKVFTYIFEVIECIDEYVDASELEWSKMEV